MVINKRELEEKSKSAFGKYTPAKENPYAKKFYEIFLKHSPRKSFTQGALSVGVLLYWWLEGVIWPLYIWATYIIVMNIAGLIYWHFEKRRLDKEIARTEKELKLINEEIADRKKYFEDLKKQIDQETNTDQKNSSGS